ncbi:MAG: 5'/3'-nucleotidase SurE [Mucinivorans sp.]
MKILITNDDGFRAPGINLLTTIARKFADEVIVVAPTHSYSGMSHSITMNEPLFVELIERGDGLTIYSCSGSPVDCIKIAMDKLIAAGQEPDLILSGINHGSNSNISVIYSGTMGAATEGAFYGIPSLGLSYTSHDEGADMAVAGYWAERVIAMYLDNPMGLCWNVNIPSIAMDKVLGVRFARQTRGVWREDFIERQDPRGRDYYWMSGQFYNSEPEAEGTDEWCLSRGYVTIVPVQMDLTDYGVLELAGADA